MSRKKFRWLPAALSLALFFAVMLGAPRMAAAAMNDGEHAGVASCSASTCHSRLIPKPHGVRQNEVKTWQDPYSPSGAHSRAFAMLDSPRGQAIAARMGLGSAQSARVCIGCHLENAAERGPKFQVSDGIGCETCHGASAGWLSSHNAPQATHAQNVANGMVALDDPKVRAGVCLDCHFGGTDSDQFVSHRMMAAGHPRVSFELDLFSDMQRHYDLDSYYAQKKRIVNGVSVWAVGQAMAIDRALTLYSGSRGAGNGVFPELYFFDCHACHRAISSDEDARPHALANPGRPIPAGTPPFNDSSIIMLMAAARVDAPGMASQLESQSRAFHVALTESRESAIAAGARLAATARSLSNTFAAHLFGREETFAILDVIMGDTLSSRYTDYAGSEQAVIAIERLKDALVFSKSVDATRAAALDPDMARLRAATEDPNTFHPTEFRALLERVSVSIRGLR